MRRIFRTLKEGFIGFFRHFSVSLSSIAVVTFTMLFLGIILILTNNINSTTKNIEGNIDIWVSIKADYENEKPQIEEEIKQITGVSRIQEITKEDALEQYIATYGDAYERFKENNPLLDGYLIYVTDGRYLEEVSNKVKSAQWAFEVMDGGDATNNLLDSLNMLRTGGSAFVIALTLLAVFLISNTIKLSIYSRQDEIEIMRIVGATNNFIRSPFLIEGILIGIFGSIIPIVIIVFGYDYLVNKLADSTIFGLFQITPAVPMVYEISVIILITSVSVGLIGSFISVTRNLRWVR
ncbi:MAG: ABC transporter permease [Erysipelothrix sp.]|nr:ABC transporter permease [Erysipelothrix sp.]